MKKVVKFGGSSLASAKQFKKVGDIIRADKTRRYVIPSAPGRRTKTDTKVTDLLYQCYDAIENGNPYGKTFQQIKERYLSIIEGLDLDLNLDFEFAKMEENFLAKAGRDYAASRGEYLNGIIMARYLDCEFVDAAEVIFFDENGTFLAEKTDEELAHRLESLDRAVIPGFYGSLPDGTIHTFSRGGSDITGSIVARAVHADVYENWTDVSGFLVTDPGVVENPIPIDTITYRELRELSYMGAGVLHEDAILMIVENTCRKPSYTITGIAGKKGFCSVTIEKAMMNAEIGFGRRVLEVFEDLGLSFEHMPSGIDTMTVFIHQDEFVAHEQQVISYLHRAVHPDSIELESDIALIAVVGRGMKSARGTAGRIFSALAHARVNVKMIDQGSSELNIIIGVRNEDFEAAVRAIYDIFITASI